MASDAPTRDPRTDLPAAIEAATAEDLDAALTGILAAGVAALGPTTAAIFLVDPDRPGLQVAATIGLDDDMAAALTEAAQSARTSTRSSPRAAGLRTTTSRPGRTAPR